MQNHFSQGTAREYVGGAFDHIGRWQFDYITATPEYNKRKTFLDLACGNMRLGKHLIPHNNKGKYIGFDCEQGLIDTGIAYELAEGWEAKQPRFIVDSNFDFGVTDVDYVWSNSLFSHLTEGDIQRCFIKLLDATKQNATFYFTFFEGGPRINPPQSHARRDFVYSMHQMSTFALASGWEIQRAEHQTHPRNQTVCRATRI